MECRHPEFVPGIHVNAQQEIKFNFTHITSLHFLEKLFLAHETACLAEPGVFFALFRSHKHVAMTDI
ncbi:hypothetical protein D3C71_2035630 [compost metagenome]